ncbi:Caffeic acid 3-O-methyltransferase [Capsicum annuum]|uniref:Caffeic acid 3-O-methyltransferase n=1 Tax=Capsicum annuum TaxID=4072 RepID=A0A2G3A089_CAPAN|nr:Caffeic acid 3-O-methyltransferase [Capsicum annuum]PHT87611.1 Caffeic acid 3-O-methyltransferase [Capsicum annuum]
MGSRSHSLTQREHEAFVFAMQLASASVLPMVLKSALELDLLEIMAKAGQGHSLMDVLSGFIVWLRCVPLNRSILDGGVPFDMAYGMKTFEYHALPAANGSVIIAECILPEAPDTSAATKSKVNGHIIMLAHNSGGLEALAKGAGFRGFRKACCAYDTWIMEFNE